MFLTVFPLFMLKDRISPVDLLSFLNKDGIHLLLLIFEKDWHYRFEHCNFFSTSTGLIWSFSRSNWSFDHKKTIDSIKRQMIEFSTLPEYDIIPQRVDKKFTKTRLPWIRELISRGYHTPGSQFFYLKFEKLQELLQNLKQNRKCLNSLVSCPGKFTSWKKLR